MIRRILRVFLALLTATLLGSAIPAPLAQSAVQRFFVNLASPTNATIADGQGVGLILEDGFIPTAEGGFVPDDGAANLPNQSGRAPALAFGRLTPGGQLQPWLAFVENNR